MFKALPTLHARGVCFQNGYQHRKFHEVCLCEFGLRHAQALLLKSSAHQKTNKISSTTIYNIMVEAQECI